MQLVGEPHFFPDHLGDLLFGDPPDVVDQLPQLLFLAGQSLLLGLEAAVEDLVLALTALETS